MRLMVFDNIRASFPRSEQRDVNANALLKVEMNRWRKSDVPKMAFTTEGSAKNGQGRGAAKWMRSVG
jgi:hypothetical protein